MANRKVPNKLVFAFVVWIAASLGVANKSDASEIVVTASNNSSILLINIQGPIIDGDDVVFFEKIRGVEKAVVTLNSPGGLLGAALNIGLKIRERGYITAVQGSGRCISSCALIWMAGREKFAESTSKIGFHGAYIVKNDKKQESAVFNALVGSYLTKLGYGNEVIIYVSSAPPDKLEYLNPTVAKRIGIEYRSLEQVKQRQ